jgi:hypothetical protein
MAWNFISIQFDSATEIWLPSIPFLPQGPICEYVRPSTCIPFPVTVYLSAVYLSSDAVYTVRVRFVAHAGEGARISNAH